LIRWRDGRAEGAAGAQEAAHLRRGLRPGDRDVNDIAAAAEISKPTRDEQSLAEALAPAAPDPLTARLAAAQILAVQRVLARENWRRLTGGERASELYPTAVKDADVAYGQLRAGLDLQRLA
jgi:hypothetical protein